MTMPAMRVKDAVRERDGYRCVRCGMTNAEHQERYKEYTGHKRGRSLHVHRKNPKLGYNLRNCITVCYPCHGLEGRKADTDDDQFEVTVSFSINEIATFEAAIKKLGYRSGVGDLVTELAVHAAEKIIGKSSVSNLTR